MIPSKVTHSWSIPPSESMRKIVSKMKTMKSILGNLGVAPTTQSQCTTPIPTLDLSYPTDLLASTDSFGLPEYLSQKLARTLTDKINTLQGYILESYEQTCRDLPELMHSPCQLNQVRRCLVNFNDIHLDRIRQQLSIHRPPCRKDAQIKKTVFNAEYKTFLEKYFEYNAYPSAPDRLVLARKSMMTLRQIEVWFQNHRNRAKKEGKSLTRLTSNLPLKLSLEFLAEKKSIFANSETENSSAPDGDSSNEETTDVDNRNASHYLSLFHRPAHNPLKATQIAPFAEAFSNSSPRHAFPTPYSCARAYDPFPNENGIYKFPPPIWKRHSPTARAHSQSISMDELAVMFISKLNLREEAICEVQNGRKASAAHHPPWFTAIITIPSHAPHPALVRAPLDYLMTPSISRFDKTVNDGSGNATSTLPFPSAKPRKVAPLLRRSRPEKSTFNSTVSSLLSSQSFNSRTSSFSSAASPRSISSSSISSTNDHVSPLFPPATPSPKPHMRKLSANSSPSALTTLQLASYLSNGSMVAKDLSSISQHTKDSLATVPFSFIATQS